MSGDLGHYLTVNGWSRNSAWLHPVARLYANGGVVLFALLLLGSWLLVRGSSSTRVARSLLAPLGVLVAVGLNQPLIGAVGEPRPFLRAPQALVLVHRSTDPAFPSDHATMAGAVAAGVLLVSWRLGLAALAAALLMAVDRVYVGAHYPVDVLAGLAVGASVATAVVLALTAPVRALLERTRVGQLLA